jgi:hypothetical protein
VIYVVLCLNGLDPKVAVAMNRVKSDYAGPFGHNGATRYENDKNRSSSRESCLSNLRGVFLVSHSYVRQSEHKNVTYRFTRG